MKRHQEIGKQRAKDRKMSGSRKIVWLLAGTILLGAAPLGATGQQAKTYTAPRTSFGVPDLQGNWNTATITTLARPSKYGDRLVLTPEEVKEIEQPELTRQAQARLPVDPNQGAIDQKAHFACDDPGSRDCGYDANWKDPGTSVAYVRGEPRSSLITYPANGQFPPLKAGAQPIQRPLPPGAKRTDNPETAEGVAGRCLVAFQNGGGPVIRPVIYNGNYKIVQTEDVVAIWVELMHDVRTVRIGGKHLPSSMRPWLGDSIGWYEGDTLVVETTNFNPGDGFPIGSNPGDVDPAPSIRSRPSPDLKIIEKFTRLGEDRLLYQFEVHDPQLWDAPWGGEYEWRTGGELYEYACHEGNYGLENILAGAREEERAAKEKRD